jgi:hypothetical protein
MAAGMSLRETVNKIEMGFFDLGMKMQVFFDQNQWISTGIPCRVDFDTHSSKRAIFVSREGFSTCPRRFPLPSSKNNRFRKAPRS